MATFPVLSTGAVAQYPLSRGTGYEVEVILFIDGTEQRCLTRGSKVRRWTVQLSQLTESELAQIEEFFDAVQGDSNTFTFVDPFSGEAVPNCRLSGPSLVTQYIAAGAGDTSLVIEETHV
jgi:hypothetical protein